MANPQRDNGKAGRILAEWAIHQFKRKYVDAIATRHEVSVSTLWNWKRALGKDKELAAEFQARLNDILSRHWAEELNENIRATLAKLRELIDGLGEATPEAVDAVARALATQADIAITREVLSAEQDGIATEPLPASEGSGASEADRLN